MRQAFSLMGLMTLIVFAGAFIAFERSQAPSISKDMDDVSAATNIPTMSLTLTSPSFAHGESIPSRFTCDGENISPELLIENVPEGTASFILVMDDSDIPLSVKQSRGIEKFDHWAVYQIPGDTRVIAEGTVVGMGAVNSMQKTGYIGPCPPDREHRYIFRLYAVGGEFAFETTPTLDQLEEMAKRLMIESATLMGRYERITK